ncbi:MAG TPA: hypothetical protein VFU19_05015 [Iamia sp.]|nr:hypothetical protein [Iamia sp.]
MRAPDDRGQAERRARILAGALVVMGVLHLVAPGPFDRIVPRVLGHPRKWTYLSGVAELAGGILTAVPRTRRTGALLATATIVAVYPANWQMALDSGFPPRDAMGWGAWLRLPLQVPMIRFAWRVAQQARPEG